jgi:3-deoxy-D-manno-octulosonic acid kinase
MLQKVRNLGVNAPEPIAYAYRGGFIYKAWLVTRKISQQQTLAELSCVNEKCARIAMNEILLQVSILINNNILHADLHPGNVLVDSSDRVFIIDFDKARVSRWDRNKLRDKYVMRWRRAVTKYGLPDMLSEMMSAGLLKN